MLSYFEKDGKKSTDFGVVVETYPHIVIAAERSSIYEVPGRHGDVEIREKALKSIMLPVGCAAKNTDQLNEFAGWVRKRGMLIFGNRPNEAYEARMISQIDVEQIMKGRQNRRFEIMFDCQPFRYIWPETSPVVIITSDHPAGSYSLQNPGNAESQPKIAIEGTGAATIAINTRMLSFTDLEGGIVVDCKAGECFNLEESLLANDRVEIGDDDFPVLEAGANNISWTGAISKITVTPRWRNG